MSEFRVKLKQSGVTRFSSDLPWPDAVRLCGMCAANSTTAKDLYAKCKRNQPLTSNQVSWVYWYAENMRDVIDINETVTVEVATTFPVTISDLSVLLSNHPVTVLKRHGWLVESKTSAVLGKFVTENTVVLYANAYILVKDLAKIVGSEVRDNQLGGEGI